MISWILSTFIGLLVSARGEFDEHSKLSAFCQASNGILGVVDLFLSSPPVELDVPKQVQHQLLSIVSQEGQNATSSDLLNQVAYISSLLHHLRRHTRISVTPHLVRSELKVVWMAIQGTEEGIRSAHEDFLLQAVKFTRSLSCFVSRFESIPRHSNMSAELILELALYGLIFVFMLLLRFRRNAKQPAVVELRQVTVVKRPSRPKPLMRAVVKSSEGDRVESWRDLPKSQPKPQPVNKVKAAIKSPNKAKPVIDLTQVVKRAQMTPVIDLRKAFVKPLTQCEECPPPPPPSPINYPSHTSDPSFDEYTEYDHYEVVEAVPFVVTKDTDFDRRRAYLKRSVTDGEVMLEVGDFRICQIFCFGIEYHYICHQGETAWDLPPELEQECASWFLSMPPSRRRRLPVPPTPLFTETATVPLFL